MDRLMRQRKFALACLFAAVTVIALFTGHITGGEFIASEAAILGLYGAANVMEKRG